MRRSLGLLAMLAALLGLAAAVGSLPDPAGIDRTSALGDAVSAPPRGLRDLALGLGLLVLGAWIFGEVLATVRLPRICGYLLFGVLVGPEAASWRPAWFPQVLDAEQMSYLKLVDGLAIAVIAFVAGGEMRLGRLRAILGQVGLMVSLQALLVVGGVLVALPLVLLPNLAGQLGVAEHRWAIASVAALLAFSNSPAVIIAVLKESKARGTMANLSLASAVMVDLVLIVLFTILMFILVATGGEGAVAGDALAVVPGLLWHLIGSAAIGVVAGAAMRTLGHGVPGQLDAVVLLAAFGIAVAGEAFHVSPLLVALAAGFAQANLRLPGSAASSGEGLAHAAERLLLPVCCVFFAVAGAGMQLDSLAALWPAALGLASIRAALLFSSTTLAASLSGVPRPARRWVWTSFVSQAGLSIALVGEAVRNLDEAPWMIELATLLLATIAIHELAGPLLMRLGLARCGEIGAADRAEIDADERPDARSANAEPAR